MAPARLRDVLDRRLAVVLAGCGALYAVVIWRPSFTYAGQRWFTLFDDAMISMTYGRNLAEGHGLVWNPGGPAVEGYTNPLWTVVMAGLHKLGLGPAVVPLAVSVLGLALLLAIIVVAAAVAARLAPGSRVAPVAAGVLVGLLYPLVYWTLRGMEVGLVTLVVLLLVWVALGLAERVSAGAVVALCALATVGLLTRDDVLVPVVVVGGWLAWRLRGRARWSVVGALAGTVVVVTAAHVAFRLGVYGEPLPNTYYLKVSGQPLGPRLERGLGTFVAVLLADLLVPLAVVVVGLRRRLVREPALVLLVGLMAALSLYSVSVGGDAWEWARLANRYVTPAAVLLGVLVAVAAEPFAERVLASRRPMAAVVTVVLVGLVVGTIDSVVGAAVGGWLTDYLGQTPTTQPVALAALVMVGLVLVVVWRVAPPRPLRDAIGRPAVLAGVVVAVVLVAAVGNAWRSWAGDGGFYTARNQGALAYGLTLAEVTDPGASVAVVWAGAPIYYARRDGVDLLGKMDPVIAHGPHHPGTPMYPGHDKYDTDHSVGQLRPDVVAQYAWFTDQTVDQLLGWGYRPYRPDRARFPELGSLDVPRALLWVRSDSPLVHRDALVPVPVDEARRTVTATP